ncbi:hypothetical protein D3C85_1223960 [compost metagenome]
MGNARVGVIQGPAPACRHDFLVQRDIRWRGQRHADLAIAKQARADLSGQGAEMMLRRCDAPRDRIQRDTARAVAAHFGWHARRIDDVDLIGRLGVCRGAQHDQSVRADTRGARAQAPAQPGQVRSQASGTIVDHDEVIAAPFHFGESNHVYLGGRCGVPARQRWYRAVAEAKNIKLTAACSCLICKPRRAGGK